MRYLAVSMPLATSEAFEGAMRCCGGTTTVGPILIFWLVTSLDGRRRTEGLPALGTTRKGADMMKVEAESMTEGQDCIANELSVGITGVRFEPQETGSFYISSPTDR
jgi:hypothetical protein